MAHFLRSCQDTLSEGPEKLAAIEVEFLSPEVHMEESDAPVRILVCTIRGYPEITLVHFG